MDDGKGEFQEWAIKEMDRINAQRHEPYQHSDADDFLMECLGSCKWEDEATRIREWFNGLDRWFD